MAENDKIKISGSDGGDGHGDGAVGNTNPAGATGFYVHGQEQPCAPDAVTPRPQLGNVPSTLPPRKGKNKNKTEESEKKEETRKTFKCKFCEKVCLSSQALGGHMNKHQKERQEEEIRQAKAILEKHNRVVPGYYLPQALQGPFQYLQQDMGYQQGYMNSGAPSTQQGAFQYPQLGTDYQQGYGYAPSHLALRITQNSDNYFLAEQQSQQQDAFGKISDNMAMSSAQQVSMPQQLRQHPNDFNTTSDYMAMQSVEQVSVQQQQEAFGITSDTQRGQGQGQGKPDPSYSSASDPTPPNTEADSSRPGGSLADDDQDVGIFRSIEEFLAPLLEYRRANPDNDDSWDQDWWDKNFGNAGLEEFTTEPL